MHTHTHTHTLTHSSGWCQNTKIIHFLWKILGYILSTCLSHVFVILPFFQGSYGVVKLAYNEDDDKYYVSPLKHLLFLFGLNLGLLNSRSGISGISPSVTAEEGQWLELFEVYIYFFRDMLQ